VTARLGRIAIVLTLFGAIFVGHAVAAPAIESEAPSCDGHKATIIGTNGPDVLVGTPGPDVIWGGGGNDVIYGLGGNDIICGGPGNDVIYGGAGNDRIFGGPGNDVIYGEAGDDTLNGGSGSNVIYGGRGDDLLIGGSGNENILYGGAGDDRLLGGSGNEDILYGGLGIDHLDGGSGNGDILDGGYGWDFLNGGSGHGDTASFASMPRSEETGSGVHASLKTGLAMGDGHDHLRNVENLEGSAFNDVLIGNRRNNKLFGGPGNDTLIGGGGRDELNGGSGNDHCRGAPPARRISCGHERVSRASAQVYLEPGIDPTSAGVVVAGGAGADDISVGFDSSSDQLSITAKKPIAAHGGCRHPGSALNEANCSLGDLPRWLTVDLGAGNDRFSVIGSLVGVGEVRVEGGPGNDVLRGGPEEDLLEGGPGADRLYGGAGGDALVGGPGGPNILEGGPGDDLLAAGPPCDGGRIIGGPGRNDVSFAELPIQPGILYASLARGIAYVKGVANCHPLRISQVQDLEGSFGPDILIGNHRGNHIIGWPGVDQIYGDGGPDVIDARDGGRDAVIQCGTKGHPSGEALIDRVDPRPRYCLKTSYGRPLPGLPKHLSR
jgi:Ca2+-binding RTX toxin-like protein